MEDAVGESDGLYAELRVVHPFRSIGREFIFIQEVVTGVPKIPVRTYEQ